MIAASTLIQSFPDTVKILNLSSSESVPPAFIVLASVVIGAAIPIIGNWFLAKRQSFVQIRSIFFTRQLNLYLKLAEMSWEGYSVSIKSDPGEPTAVYPTGYRSFQHLMDWLNHMVEIIDRNRLLLDQPSYKKFDSLNHKILADRDAINSLAATGGIIDWHARAVGRQSVSDIQKLTEEFVSSLRHFLAKRYKVPLEKVL